MRFAVISDVQGNIDALRAVLERIDARERPVDRIVCAGDVVGLGPHPNDVIDVLRDREIETVRGNYDDAVAFDRLSAGMDFADAAEEEADSAAVQWTRRTMNPANLEFLRSLPRDVRLTRGAGRIDVKRDADDDATSEFRKTFVLRALFGGLASPRKATVKRARVVHGSPRALNEFIRPDTAASILGSIAREAEADVLVSGHARVSFHRPLNGLHFVGVAPVSGQFPQGRAEYAVITIGDEVAVEFEQVQYNPETYLQALRSSGLPLSLAARSGLRLV